MRQSLVWACIAVGIVGFSLDAAAKGGKGLGKGQRQQQNNNPNQTPNQQQNQNQNQNTGTTPNMSFGGDSTQVDDDKRKLASDKEAVTKAEKALTDTVNKLKSDFDSSADRQALITSQKAAQADYLTQRERVLATLKANPAYQAILNQREQFNTLAASETTSDAQRAEMAEQRMEVVKKAAQMESDAVGADPKASEAQRKASDLSSQLVTQNAQFQASIKNTPEYSAAKDAIDKAKAAVVEDEKKLKADLAAKK